MSACTWTPADHSGGLGVVPTKASALTVYEAPTPRFQVPRYDTSGTYPQVRRDDVDLRAVNAALRRVVLEDQQRYAPSARALAKVAGEHAVGVYQTSVDRRLLSASTVVVSALMPATELNPGGTEGDGWVAGTIRVPSRAAVRLTDLFARPAQALPVLAREWKAQFRRTTPRRWVCVTQLPSLLLPSASNYRNFALIPRGLAVGIHGHASCAGLQATVPYARLRPYLSKLGERLITGVRPAQKSDAPGNPRAVSP
jgi:hypothetical protein